MIFTLHFGIFPLFLETPIWIYHTFNIHGNLCIGKKLGRISRSRWYRATTSWRNLGTNLGAFGHTFCWTPKKLGFRCFFLKCSSLHFFRAGHVFYCFLYKKNLYVIFDSGWNDFFERRYNYYQVVYCVCVISHTQNKYSFYKKHKDLATARSKSLE